jgi:hypothetical protein
MSSAKALLIMMGRRWITTLRKLPTSRLTSTVMVMKNAGLDARASIRCMWREQK